MHLPGESAMIDWVSLFCPVIEDDAKKPVSDAAIDQVAEQVRTVVHM